MRIFKLFLALLILIATTTVVSVWLYLGGLRPELSGSMRIPAMTASADVHFDSYGIPHIYAENAADAYLVLGFVHAQDRLFQMDLLRRVGGGRLSEFFGEDVVEVDKLFHTLGTPIYAAESASNFDSAPDELKEIVTAYLRGVNHFVETGFTPIEYTLAGLPKEPFDVQDMYQIAGYMAFSFALGLRTEPVVEYIASILGSDYLQDLALHHEDGMPLALSGREDVDMPVLSASLREKLDNLAMPLFIGSNNWAVSGIKTASGKPILANDTHIQYSQPSTWYEAHLEYPGACLYGNFLAGIPFPLVGHNQHIAWGLTMFENDDTDFYFETFHPDDPSLVRSKDSLWVPVNIRKVDIAVKNSDTVHFEVTETPHGPLVQSFFSPAGEQAVSLYWTYTKKPNLLPEAFFKLNHASKMDEARDAVCKIHAPGLNIAYADTDNNIALWSAALLIERPAHVNSKRILDGASGKDDPIGFYPFSANPQVENPESGVVYSANSQHDTTAAGVIHPGYYTAPNRMVAIRQWLESDRIWSKEDMMSMVSDHVSAEDERLAKHLYSLLLESDADQEVKDFFAPLSFWNGSHATTSPEPVLYYPVIYHLLEKTFLDYLGQEHFETFLSTHLMKRTIYKLYYLDESPWFVEAVTNERQNLQDMAAWAFTAAKEQLEQQYPDGNLDVWGEVHTVTHPHPMGVRWPLDKIFNVGPFGISGTNESIDQQGFRQNKSGLYPAKHGPQMRILIDLGDIHNSMSVNPTGQSGNIFSPHYSDQAELFATHQFRPQLTHRDSILKHSHDHLRVSP